MLISSKKLRHGYMLTIASRDGKVKILKFAESELGLMLEPAEMVTIAVDKYLPYSIISREVEFSICLFIFEFLATQFNRKQRI